MATSIRNDFAAFPAITNGIVQAIAPRDAIAIARFEAKRLDTGLAKAREKEYVIGEYAQGQCSRNTGGIERFKNGTHGKPIERNAALVAYIQTDDTSLWLTKINQWIEEEIHQTSDKRLNWKEQDKLSKRQGFLCHDEFESDSERPSHSPIHLHHFWILLGSLPLETVA